jgi:hypothetical protein
MSLLTELPKYFWGLGATNMPQPTVRDRIFRRGWRFFSRATQFKKEVKQTVMIAWKKSRGNHFHPR